MAFDTFFRPILVVVLVISIVNGQLPHDEYGLPSEFRREFKAERTTKAPTKLPEIVLPKLPEPPRIPDTEYGLPKDNFIPFTKISNEIKIVEDNKFLPLPEVPRTTKMEVTMKPVMTKESKVEQIEMKMVMEDKKIPMIMLPAGLPTLPMKPKISKPQKEYGLPKEMKEVFKKPELPKMMLPSGLPKLPEKPVIPKIPKMTEAKEIKVVIKEPKSPKIMLPMGLPKLPAKPEIPKVPVTEAPYSVEKEYDLPKKMKVEFMEPKKPKVMLPSGLPKLPEKPVIKEPIKKIEGPYPPAMPHKTYDIPMKMKILFKEPEKPKVMLPMGLPSLPAKPVIPKIEVTKAPKIEVTKAPKIEVTKEEPSALPLKPTIFAPDLPKLPVKPKPTNTDGPYPAKIVKSQPGVISREMKVYIPKKSPEIVVEARPMFSAPYPAALPHSEYGLPPV